MHTPFLLSWSGHHTHGIKPDLKKNIKHRLQSNHSEQFNPQDKTKTAEQSAQLGDLPENNVSHEPPVKWAGLQHDLTW